MLSDLIFSEHSYSAVRQEILEQEQIHQSFVHLTPFVLKMHFFFTNLPLGR